MDIQKPTAVEPKLAKPGAGIGFLEMQFLKYYIKPIKMRRLEKAVALSNVPSS